MSRVPIAITAGVAAIATTAVIATAGSAQGPAPTSLHLVAKSQNTAGFFPTHRPRPGARFGFGDRVTGDDTGYDRGVCTLFGKNQKNLCTFVLKLSKGTLTVEGFLSQHSTKTPVAITGGTGAYNGARGTLIVTDLNPNTTDLQITLLP
jgi:hypothetical protein